MSVTPHQRFTYREIPREIITNAPYNPRKISAYARKKLKKQLQDVGLIETLIWNQRTGHLVSGHHRLELLDDLEGGRSYTVGVAVVDLSEDDERTQNVFLNNIYAQGTYTEEGFVAIVKDGATLDAMGFTIADLEQEFGVVPAIDEHFAAMREAQAPLVDAIREVEKNRKFGELDQRVAEQNADVGYGESDYTLAIIFPSADDRDAFAARFGADSQYLLTVDQLAQYFEPAHQWRVISADHATDVHVSGDSPEPDHAGALQSADDQRGRAGAAAGEPRTGGPADDAGLE